MDNDFSDLKATRYKMVALSDPYIAFVNVAWKEAVIIDTRKYAQQIFFRGIQGRVWIDHTGAWNTEYNTERDGKQKTTYLPINEVLPLIGYGATSKVSTEVK